MEYKKNKNHSGIEGFSFGTVDAIVNILGILMGLGAIGNRLLVIVGILVATLANSFGNATGIHVSQEMEGVHTKKEVWQSTLFAFLSTFLVSFVLVVPLFFAPLTWALAISWVLGMAFLVILGFQSAELTNSSKSAVILEYVFAGGLVTITAFLLGKFALRFFQFL